MDQNPSNRPSSPLPPPPPPPHPNPQLDPLRRLRRRTKRAQFWLRLARAFKVALLVIGVVGSITFGQFLLEEAIQQTTWGCFAFEGARDYVSLLECGALIESISETLSWTNRVVGWLNPFTFLGYRAYTLAAEMYVKAIRTKACVNITDRYYAFVCEEVWRRLQQRR